MEQVVIAILDALGGGLPAVIILGLGYMYHRERQASTKLTEKLIDISRDTVTALSDLKNKIDGGS